MAVGGCPLAGWLKSLTWNHFPIIMVELSATLGIGCEESIQLTYRMSMAFIQMPVQKGHLRWKLEKWPYDLNIVGAT